jgi:hypothetical protein
MADLNTSTLWGGVEPVVRKFFGLEEKKRKKVFTQIFKESNGDEPVRHSMEMAGPGQLVRKTENGVISQLEIRQGPNKTWNYEVYAGRVTVSWELARDHKVREVKKAAGALGKSSALTPEYLAAQFLDRGFNSSYPATADGKELCATDHLIVGTNSSTGSNELATPAALSETGLEDIITQMMTVLGSEGMLAAVQPKKLIVPAALALTAEKLTRAEKTLGSANNDPNVVGGKVSVIVNPFLTSNTRWFVTTDEDDSLFWEWDVRSQVMEDQVVTHMKREYVTFSRFRYGCDNWRGIFGSAAS